MNICATHSQKWSIHKQTSLPVMPHVQNYSRPSLCSWRYYTSFFFYSHTRRASGASWGTNPFNWCSHWENAPCLTITQEGSLHPSKPTLCPAAGALKLCECSIKIFVRVIRIFLIGTISSDLLNIHMEILNSLWLTCPHIATNLEVHY